MQVGRRRRRTWQGSLSGGGEDIAKGTSSACALGCSSPTPSIEGIDLMLTFSANGANRLSSIDISHDFMHSPIFEGELVVLRLPLSISLPNGIMGKLRIFSFEESQWPPKCQCSVDGTFVIYH